MLFYFFVNLGKFLSTESSFQLYSDIGLFSAYLCNLTNMVQRNITPAAFLLHLMQYSD